MASVIKRLVNAAAMLCTIPMIDGRGGAVGRVQIVVIFQHGQVDSDVALPFLRCCSFFHHCSFGNSLKIQMLWRGWRLFCFVNPIYLTMISNI